MGLGGLNISAANLPNLVKSATGGTTGGSGTLTAGNQPIHATPTAQPQPTQSGLPLTQATTPAPAAPATSPTMAGGGSVAPNPIFNPWGINYFQQPGGLQPAGVYSGNGGFNPDPMLAFNESQQTPYSSGNPLAGYGLMNPLTGGSLNSAWMSPGFYMPSSYGTPANATFNQTYNPWLSLMLPQTTPYYGG